MPCVYLHLFDSFLSLAETSGRFASFLYTPERKVAIERVWKETMDEFEFAGIQSIMDSIRR